MTISQTSNTIRQEADGVDTNFTFPFRIYNGSDLRVFLVVRATDIEESDLVLGVGYTVNINSGSEGGSVDMASAPAGTYDVFIKRDMELVQDTSIPVVGPFPGENVESSLDVMVMLIQQLQEQINRSILQAEATDSATSITLPTPIAGRSLGWDSNGDLVNSTIALDTITDSNLAKTIADADGNTGIETERVSNNDTLHHKIGGNDDIIHTASQVALQTGVVISDASGVSTLEFTASGIKLNGGDYLTANATSIEDADGDTKIYTEKNADEDIIRMDTAGTERFKLDSDGVLTLSGQISFDATQSSLTTLVSGVAKKIDFATENEDIGGNFASSRFTVPVGGAGKYLLESTVGISSLADQDYLAVIIRVNGVAKRYGRLVTSDTSGNGSSPSISIVLRLADLDEVELWGLQNSGSDKDTNVATTATWFTGTKVV